ncbi:MAG: hypothetical protein AVDCRST_MAG13-2454 [uncultured Solirubrobacteraceae bacterium]|uniref:Uncharacterized protein n=1 Tax=uncultured Solirubrobacteraceae bacterium TaxID=1162706 RepID=A0A6J4SSP0_9ACTN|nr:MAG: hypothetical protein AVDCRST_MAG13-2454 [uncultured Solirubrobacteraceae bacterium]
MQRHGDADGARVDEPERQAGEQDARQVRVDEVLARRVRDRRQHPEDDRRGAHGERVLADVEEQAPCGLAGQQVLDGGRDDLREQRRHQASGEEQGEGEGRRDRHLLVVAAARDLQRDELAEDDPEREQAEQQRRRPERGRLVVEHRGEQGEAEEGDRAAEAAGRGGEQERHGRRRVGTAALLRRRAPPEQPRPLAELVPRAELDGEGDHRCRGQREAAVLELLHVAS